MPVTSQDMCLMTVQQACLFWDEVEWRLDSDPAFLRAWPKSELARRIGDGTIAVWTLGQDLVVLTQIAVSGKRKVMQILFAHGTELDKYLALCWDIFHRYAALMDCERIELFGRSGWQRKLRCFPGVELEYVVLGCDVRPAVEH